MSSNLSEEQKKAIVAEALQDNQGISDSIKEFSENWAEQFRKRIKGTVFENDMLNKDTKHEQTNKSL